MVGFGVGNGEAITLEQVLISVVVEHLILLHPPQPLALAHQHLLDRLLLAHVLSGVLLLKLGL